MQLKKKKIIIACAVFADELRAVLPPDVEVLWLGSHLHAVPDRLAAELQAAGAAAQAQELDVFLLIGYGCHPEMTELARCCGGRLPGFKNCIEAFAGDALPALEENKTLVITAGWVRAWPGRASELGWDVTEMRIQHGRYDRILVLDSGINPVTDEEIWELFELLQVPIEVVPLSLEALRRSVLELLGEEL